MNTIASERVYFALLAAAILAIAVAGFLRTYFLVPLLGLPEGALAPTAFVHVHGAIAFSWCVLLLVQACLVIAGNVQAHRKLGAIGFLLYLGLVVTGPVVAVRSAVRYGSPPEELAFLAVSLGNVVAYTLILGAAFLFRHRPAIHKRLMMLGMVVLLTAPFGRLIDLPYQLAHVVGPSLVVLALMAWDWHSLGKVSRLTLLLGPAVLLWELAPNLYMESDWWMSVSRALVGLAA